VYSSVSVRVKKSRGVSSRVEDAIKKMGFTLFPFSTAEARSIPTVFQSAPTFFLGIFGSLRSAVAFIGNR